MGGSLLARAGITLIGCTGRPRRLSRWRRAMADFMHFLVQYRRCGPVLESGLIGTSPPHTGHGSSAAAAASRPLIGQPLTTSDEPPEEVVKGSGRVNDRLTLAFRKRSDASATSGTSAICAERQRAANEALYADAA